MEQQSNTKLKELSPQTGLGEAYIEEHAKKRFIYGKKTGIFQRPNTESRASMRAGTPQKEQ